MKKEDQYHKMINEPQFSDADYQEDMRVDPLTTSERISQEISEIDSNRKSREAEAENKKRELEAREREEFAAWKAEKEAKAELERKAQE